MRRGPVTAAFGGRAVRVSIFVQGGEAEVERVLSEVVRALAASGGSGALQPPGPSAGPWPSAGREPVAEPRTCRLPLEDLTSREVEVLDLVARGYDNATIAAHLGISTRTVRNHLNSVFSKLGVAYRPRAVVLAREAGLGRT